MVNETTVLEALKAVQDPELHQSIVALNMVRNVAVNGSNVAVDIALTVAGCPLHQKSNKTSKRPSAVSIALARSASI